MPDRWQTIHYGNKAVVVIPIDDIAEHRDLDVTCPCLPKFKLFDLDGAPFEIPMITHNSFDGREATEPGREPDA